MDNPLAALSVEHEEPTIGSGPTSEGRPASKRRRVCLLNNYYCDLKSARVIKYICIVCMYVCMYVRWATAAGRGGALAAEIANQRDAAKFLKTFEAA
jgi:hypothetical protein